MLICFSSPPPSRSTQAQVCSLSVSPIWWPHLINPALRRHPAALGIPSHLIVKVPRSTSKSSEVPQHTSKFPEVPLVLPNLNLWDIIWTNTIADKYRSKTVGLLRPTLERFGDSFHGNIAPPTLSFHIMHPCTCHWQQWSPVWLILFILDFGWKSIFVLFLLFFSLFGFGCVEVFLLV